MIFPQRDRGYRPPEFNLATNTILGTEASIRLERTFPLEGILIRVSCVAGATGPTFVTGTQPGIDNILNIVKKINLSINDGEKPRSVINVSGIGLLEFNANEGFNLDPATWASVLLSQGASIAANVCFQVNYFVPLVGMNIGEPLRSRMVLPVNLHKQDPVLTLTFENAASIYSAGSIANIFVEVVPIQREMQQKEMDATLKLPGGFIAFDLLESLFTVPLGVAQESKIPLPLGGRYANLGIRHYLGGAAITRNVPDEVGIGTTVATGFGTENIWTLESGGVARRKFTWKSLQCRNAYSRPLPINTQASAPQIGGIVAATTGFNPAASVMLDFVGDGLSGESNGELGSLLDANIPEQSGLKWELIGRTASVATNASLIYLIGRRFFGVDPSFIAPIAR